jgi:hypothetical protein
MKFPPRVHHTIAPRAAPATTSGRSDRSARGSDRCRPEAPAAGGSEADSARWSSGDHLWLPLLEAAAVRDDKL